MSLLNTPQSSGKLVRWGMALQELNLVIKYRRGKANARADTLSRYSASLLPDDCTQTQTHPLVAPVDISMASGECKKGREDTFSQRQHRHPETKEIRGFLETRELPIEEKRARELVLSKPTYTILNELLYLLELDKTLRVVPPTSDRHQLFMEAHQCLLRTLKGKQDPQSTQSSLLVARDPQGYR